MVVAQAVALLVLIVVCVVIVRARSSEREILGYYDASLDLLATVDRSGRFRRVNPAWQRAVGHPADAMRSRPLVEFVHRDDRESTSAHLAAIHDGSRDSVWFRNRFRTGDGKYRWLEWNASALRSGRALRVVARDVTAQRRTEQQLANSSRWLETNLAERTRELDEARAEMLALLAIAVEYRDDETFQHTERVGVIAAELAARLGLRPDKVERLREAALLHDVGKIAIPDCVLLKPGSLSVEEQRVMESHTALGARMLARSSSPVLQMAAVIAATHHEWWNGAGYPSGLAGERIPLVGRVVAVADVFDALTHERPYKPAWPLSQAIARIRSASGLQFDPAVVEAFLTLQGDPVASASVAAQEERITTRPRPMTSISV
jgi:PAS domain S-box-containing protein/putative nucleotidyltransferase with HDIG domain